MTVLPQLERELIDAHGRRRRVPGRRSRRRGWPPPRLIGAAVPVAAALVAAAVVVVFAGLGGGRRSGPAAPAAPNQIVLGASTLSPRLPLSEAIDRSLPVLRRRLHAVFAHARVLRFANSVVIDGVPRAGRPEAIALAAPGQLRFFDWEADVLTPNGRTVAQLPAQATAALQISQGTADGPGATGPGSLSLYAAVRLASRQPAEPPGTSHTAHGARYYLFGAPGSTACTTAAADRGTAPPPRQHCLLAGPAASTGALSGQLPAGVAPRQGQELVVPPGLAVLQAVAPGITPAAPGLADPGARFYVLRDRPLLTGGEITHPRAGTDASGAPDVQFGLTPAGAAAFQHGTAVIARRGASVSTGGMTFAQHFAIALDDRLLSVPQIDFRQYPDGVRVTGTGGADITGGFTAASARTLALLLRYGSLPVDLVAR